MKALEALDLHLKNRAQELERFKEEGRKIIGYYPGGYVPEEIILACGAIPVGLHRGGEHEPVLIAGAYLPRWYDTFIRSQIGFKVLKGEPVYDLMDLFVIPITDNNVRILGDAWEFYHLGKIFRFGVPTANRTALTYISRHHAFKEEWKRKPGKDYGSHPGEAIVLCNRKGSFSEK
jgi:benzoyl-CoA reductase/2-hydroxyglutaryl-CoA dehydratase subunit BcrC/BadD/HgdB